MATDTPDLPSGKPEIGKDGIAFVTLDENGNSSRKGLVDPSLKKGYFDAHHSKQISPTEWIVRFQKNKKIYYAKISL